MHEIPPPPPPYVPAPAVAPRRRTGLVGFLAGVLSAGALAGGVALYSAQADDSVPSVVMPAAAVAADPSTTPTLPPKVQSLIDCLKSSGIEMPSVEKSAGGGGSIRWNFPAEGELKAAAEKCVPEGAKFGLGGVMGTRPDGSTIELPQLGQEIKAKIDAFQKCLADNGVKIEPRSGARPDVEKLKAAAEACSGVRGLGAGRPGR